MPVVLQDIAHGHGAIFHCSGHVTGEELIQSKYGLDRQQDRLSKWRFAIVDHTECAQADYSLSDIQRLTEVDRRLAQFVPPGFIIAVVSPDDFVFGVSRMWQSLADALHWEILIARQRDVAENWIRHRAKRNFDLDLPKIFEDPAA